MRILIVCLALLTASPGVLAEGFWQDVKEGVRETKKEVKSGAKQTWREVKKAGKAVGREVADTARGVKTEVKKQFTEE